MDAAAKCRTDVTALSQTTLYVEAKNRAKLLEYTNHDSTDLLLSMEFSHAKPSPC